MTFQIESGVPMPKLTRGRVSATKFPLDKMEVGESFLIPVDFSAADAQKTLDSWRRKVLAAKKKIGEGEIKTFRVPEGLRVFCVN